MSAATEIYQAGSESFDEVLYLLRRFFQEEGFPTPEEKTRSSLQLMLAHPDSAIFLARRGSQALGVATVTTSVCIEYGRSAEMEDLYVLPEARRGGVAGALTAAVCAWCEQQGCSTLLVTVTPEGDTAHHLTDFYQRRGFVNTGRVILERALAPDRAGPD